MASSYNRQPLSEFGAGFYMNNNLRQVVDYTLRVSSFDANHGAILVFHHLNDDEKRSNMWSGVDLSGDEWRNVVEYYLKWKDSKRLSKDVRDSHWVSGGMADKLPRIVAACVAVHPW